jgi:hypothetical protein
MSRVHERFDEEPELIDDPELEAELEAGVQELERGEWVDGDEILRRLRNGEYETSSDRRPTR